MYINPNSVKAHFEYIYFLDKQISEYKCWAAEAVYFF